MWQVPSARTVRDLLYQAPGLPPGSGSAFHEARAFVSAFGRCGMSRDAGERATPTADAMQVDFRVATRAVAR